MCRLSANLCQDKSSMKVKNLFTNGLNFIYMGIFFSYFVMFFFNMKDFMPSLSRCMEMQNQLLLAQLNMDNCENNASDLDLYHSLIRFLK